MGLDSCRFQNEVRKVLPEVGEELLVAAQKSIPPRRGSNFRRDSEIAALGAMLLMLLYPRGTCSSLWRFVLTVRQSMTNQYKERTVGVYIQGSKG